MSAPVTTRLLALVFALCLVLAACSSDGDTIPADGDTDGEIGDGDEPIDGDNDGDVEIGDGDQDEDAAPLLWLDENGLHVDGVEGGVVLVGLPKAVIDGAPVEPEGACTLNDGTLSCPATNGTLSLSLNDNGSVHAAFSATADVTLQQIGIAFTGKIDGATTWLSNGFQSWSQSGMLVIGPETDADEFTEDLLKRGDPEVLRDGTHFSWWYTAIGTAETGDSSKPYLVAGVLSSDRFKSWARVYNADGKLVVNLNSGGTGESVALVSGAQLDGERWRLDAGAGAANLNSALLAYGDALPARRPEHPREPDAGWNSWYELWDGVSEADIRANAPLARQILAPELPEGTPLRIVVDDGWQQHWGVWEPNDKFPLGMDGLAADLIADGFETGIWLAPFLAHEDTQLVSDHPDWFVAGTEFMHTPNGPMRILDVTHPDAAAYLGQVITRVVGWGYHLLKIDFLFAGTFEGTRHENVTGMQAYHIGMQIIRDAAGDSTLLTTVGAPPIPSLPYSDAWRIGGDIAFVIGGPNWQYAVNQARNISSRWFLCNAVLCDPDPMMLRSLSQDEVGFGAWVVAIAGGVYFLSDNLPALDEARYDSFPPDTVTLGLSGQPMQPADMFPQEPPDKLSNHISDLISQQNKHVLPQRWQTQDGRTLYFNLGTDAVTVDGTEIAGHAAGIVKE